MSVVRRGDVHPCGRLLLPDFSRSDATASPRDGDVSTPRFIAGSTRPAIIRRNVDTAETIGSSVCVLKIPPSTAERLLRT